MTTVYLSGAANLEMVAHESAFHDVDDKMFLTDAYCIIILICCHLHHSLKMLKHCVNLVCAAETLHMRYAFSLAARLFCRPRR